MTKLQMETASVNVQMSRSSGNPRAKQPVPIQPDAAPASKVNSLRPTAQSNLKTLTPLQRQRLDAAVMMLVNYLMSASFR